MLPKELKAKWVKALRSGEYQQGQGQLCTRTNDGSYSFCCLGVLEDVAGKTSRSEMSINGWGYLQTPELINALRSKIAPGDCDLDANDIQAKLVRFNDGAKLVLFNDGSIDGMRKPKSFKWIASYIERYL